MRLRGDAGARYNSPMGHWGWFVGAACAGAAVSPLLRRAVAAFTGVRSPGAPTAAVTAATWALLAWLGPHDVVAALVLAPLALAGVVLAYVDVAQQQLPDLVVLSAYPVVGATLIVGGVVAVEPDRLLTAAAAGACSLALYGALCLATGGLGFGDVKLSGLLGLALGWLGWQPAATAVALAFLVGAAHGIVVLASRRADTTIPFGPSMLLGALGAVLAA